MPHCMHACPIDLLNLSPCIPLRVTGGSSCCAPHHPEPNLHLGIFLHPPHHGDQRLIHASSILSYLLLTMHNACARDSHAPRHNCAPSLTTSPHFTSCSHLFLFRFLFSTLVTNLQGRYCHLLFHSLPISFPYPRFPYVLPCFCTLALLCCCDLMPLALFPCISHPVSPPSSLVPFAGGREY